MEHDRLKSELTAATDKLLSSILSGIDGCLKFILWSLILVPKHST